MTLRAHLLSGVTPPAKETLQAFVDRSPNAASLRKLADLRSAAERDDIPSRYRDIQTLRASIR